MIETYPASVEVFIFAIVAVAMVILYKRMTKRFLLKIPISENHDSNRIKRRLGILRRIKYIVLFFLVCYIINFCFGLLSDIYGFPGYESIGIPDFFEILLGISIITTPFFIIILILMVIYRQILTSGTRSDRYKMREEEKRELNFHLFYLEKEPSVKDFFLRFLVFNILFILVVFLILEVNILKIIGKFDIATFFLLSFFILPLLIFFTIYKDKIMKYERFFFRSKEIKDHHFYFLRTSFVIFSGIFILDLVFLHLASQPRYEYWADKTFWGQYWNTYRNLFLLLLASLGNYFIFYVYSLFRDFRLSSLILSLGVVIYIGANILKFTDSATWYSYGDTPWLTTAKILYWIFFLIAASYIWFNFRIKEYRVLAILLCVLVLAVAPIIFLYRPEGVSDLYNLSQGEKENISLPIVGSIFGIIVLNYLCDYFMNNRNYGKMDSEKEHQAIRPFRKRRRLFAHLKLGAISVSTMLVLVGFYVIATSQSPGFYYNEDIWIDNELEEHLYERARSLQIKDFPGLDQVSREYINEEVLANHISMGKERSGESDVHIKYVVDIQQALEITFVFSNLYREFTFAEINYSGVLDRVYVTEYIYVNNSGTELVWIGHDDLTFNGTFIFHNTYVIRCELRFREHIGKKERDYIFLKQYLLVDSEGQIMGLII